MLNDNRKFSYGFSLKEKKSFYCVTQFAMNVAQVLCVTGTWMTKSFHAGQRCYLTECILCLFFPLPALISSQIDELENKR